MAPPAPHPDRHVTKEMSRTRLGRFLNNSSQLFSESVYLDDHDDTSDQPLVDDSSVRRRIRVRKDILCLTRSTSCTNEARVLVLYTGGTIGMVRNADGALAPIPHAMEDIIRSNITMHDEEYSRLRFSPLADIDENGPEDSSLDPPHLLPLVLPDVPGHRRVIYAIYEYDPLLDSSNMTMDDWITIAKDVRRSYDHFDGFVVLHGTDTLAYTASALSFMLENLGKPVIVTGSQIPCFETRTDGRDNFVGALILAGNYDIPEVCVYFRHELMRGNRTVKMSAGDLDAFHTPNVGPLVKAGIDFHVDRCAIRKHSRRDNPADFRVHTRLDRNVVLLRLFPSIGSETIRHFLRAPIRGVVLQCYGAGNIPSNRSDIVESIGEATKRGVLVVCVTQCLSGGVSGLYATGKALLDAGAICGADMTAEAALTKLSYVLSKSEWDNEKKREMMNANMAGEVTTEDDEVAARKVSIDLISSKAALDDARSPIKDAFNHFFAWKVSERQN